MSLCGEPFSGNDDWPVVIVDMKFAFDLDIVTSPHAAGEAAKPRAGADDPV